MAEYKQWRVKPYGSTNYEIQCETGPGVAERVAIVWDLSLAKSVCREHNAHAALVEACEMASVAWSRAASEKVLAALKLAKGIADDQG